MKLKRIILLLLTVMFSFSYGEVFAKDGNSLKKALKNKFLIGVSVNTKLHEVFCHSSERK